MYNAIRCFQLSMPVFKKGSCGFFQLSIVCRLLYKVMSAKKNKSLGLKVAKLCTVDVTEHQMFSSDFQVTWSKVKVTLLVFCNVVHSIFKDYFDSQFNKNLMQRLSLADRCSLIKWSKVKVYLLIFILSVFNNK